ncbi:MAG: DISARM system phospholipase D-like protein DrmC [Micromonosporaceae bacterium]|nr:DISARM system phospholipase D-like protein DrmC [Micromonosporaceae bacterium]
MTPAPQFERLAQQALAQLGPGHLASLAEHLAAGRPEQVRVPAVPVPGFADSSAELRAAQRADGLTEAEATAYLRGLAAGYAQRRATMSVEPVWSGPTTHRVPVRTMAQVVIDLIGEATSELLLMTYSAKPYPPILTALGAALIRDVTVTIVVETLHGAGSALAGAEPAAAFAALPAVQLWHWPVEQRPNPGAKTHAKVAVADRRLLLVSSANLTESGMDTSMEAGVLVRGGSTPARVADHIAELQTSGILVRLRPG